MEEGELELIEKAGKEAEVVEENDFGDGDVERILLNADTGEEAEEEEIPAVTLDYIMLKELGLQDGSPALESIYYRKIPK